MKLRHTAVLLLALSGLAAAASAETLLVQRVQQENAAAMPKRGMTMAEVQARFGRDWTADLLARRDILASQPGFVADGVTTLHTSAWRLQRR